MIKRRDSSNLDSPSFSGPANEVDLMVSLCENVRTMKNTAQNV